MSSRAHPVLLELCLGKQFYNPPTVFSLAHGSTLLPSSLWRWRQYGSPKPCYPTTRRRKPEEFDLNLHRRKNLKSLTNLT